jgi:dihydroorotate dehydrogenase (fumarate)
LKDESPDAFLKTAKENSMIDLSTTYMGLRLNNPIIVASSDLTKTHEGMKKCEAAGAGAIVLKSLFEEQFLIEGGIPETDPGVYPEALDYMRSGGLMDYAPHQICGEIERGKKEVGIPIIASINCLSSSLWPRFARQVEDAGADGLELNIYDLPIDLKESCAARDAQYFKIIKDVRESISIPVSVKLVPEISSLPYLANQLAEAGCRALVFFNWFLEPDIDVNTLKTRSRKGHANFHQSLRWVGLLADRIKSDIAASGGVRGAEDVIKQILAGAKTVQICSLFYQKGLGVIKDLLEDLASWMTEHRYAALEDFRGELSFKNQELRHRDLGEAAGFFRAQYLKVYSK